MTGHGFHQRPLLIDKTSIHHANRRRGTQRDLGPAPFKRLFFFSTHDGVKGFGKRLRLGGVRVRSPNVHPVQTRQDELRKPELHYGRPYQR